MDTLLQTSHEIYQRTIRGIAPLPCQEAYLHRLAAILSMHLRRNLLMDEGCRADELPRVSALVVAPTGQGKTFLLQKMAEAAQINLIRVDCSTLAAEGWKGVSLGKRLLAAREEAGSSKSFARSVLFLDEVDKLRFWGTDQDQGNPMSNILQLYNGGCVTAEGSGHESEQIDVSRFTVLMGGAFDGIQELVKKRLRSGYTMGFRQAPEEGRAGNMELMEQVSPEDLAQYGMMPELLGRVGTILTMPPLGLEDYRQLLGAEQGSVWAAYRNYLNRLYGVQFRMTEGCVDMLARRCMESGSGARAAQPLVDEWMRDALRQVEQDASVSHVILEAEGEQIHVRYLRGARAYCFHDPGRCAHPEHWITAGSVRQLTDKLCRYYRKGGGDLRGEAVFRAFLLCTLRYLRRNVVPEDFCFDSLERLARTLHSRGSFSEFDRIVCRQGHEAYLQFQSLRTKNTQQELILAMAQVMRFLEEKHGKIRVYFKLKGKRK